jgi:hypothetical protein
VGELSWVSSSEQGFSEINLFSEKQDCEYIEVRRGTSFSALTRSWLPSLSDSP